MTILLTVSEFHAIQGNGAQFVRFVTCFHLGRVLIASWCNQQAVRPALLSTDSVKISPKPDDHNSKLTSRSWQGKKKSVLPKLCSRMTLLMRINRCGRLSHLGFGNSHLFKSIYVAPCKHTWLVNKWTCVLRDWKRGNRFPDLTKFFDVEFALHDHWGELCHFFLQVFKPVGEMLGLGKQQNQAQRAHRGQAHTLEPSLL